jgi:hypothetical protein
MTGVMAHGIRNWYRTVTGTLRGRPWRPQPAKSSEVLAPEQCPILHLDGFPDVPVLQPGLPFYIDLLARRQGFAFVKRTHGFWDALVFLSESVPAIRARVAHGKTVTARMVRLALDDEDIVASIERRAEVGIPGGANFLNHFRNHFYTELIEDLQCPLAVPGYIEANSFEGYPNSHNAMNPAAKLRQVYHSFHTSGRPAHDALVWKQAALDGGFWQVVEAIRDVPVVLVGPSHLRTLGHHLGLSEFHHIEIPPAGAPAVRDDLLHRCSEVLGRVSSNGRPAAVFYQAGGLSFWLIYRLFPSALHTFHLDVGRSLDIWYPEVVGTQPWFETNRQQVVRNMRLQHLFG